MVWSPPTFSLSPCLLHTTVDKAPNKIESVWPDTSLWSWAGRHQAIFGFGDRNESSQVSIRMVCCGLGCDWCQISAVRREGGGIWAAWNRNHQVCHADTWRGPGTGEYALNRKAFPVFLHKQLQLKRQSSRRSLSHTLHQTLQRCFLPLTKQKWDLVSFGCG